MQALVEARGGEPFRTLSDFAGRVDPKLLNKRQLESLIAAGGFEAIEPNRAGVHQLAAALLGTAQAAAAARESAQAALFGEAHEPALGMIVPQVSWSLAETMAQEKEAFGFYFSGHPVDAWRAVADAQGALTFAECSAMPAPVGGGRLAVTLAALIEEVQWRASQNNGGGRRSSGDDRYMQVTLSDRTGQYRASCSNAETQARLERLAVENPAVLLQVELAWREGEEVVRVRIHGATALAELARRTPGRLVVPLAEMADIDRLAQLLGPRRGQGRGEVIVEAQTGVGTARLRLGADFLIDHELQAAVTRSFGRAAPRALPPAPRLMVVN
jgi:DNA polymerase-3 subunit alpha